MEWVRLVVSFFRMEKNRKKVENEITIFWNGKRGKKVKKIWEMDIQSGHWCNPLQEDEMFNGKTFLDYGIARIWAEYMLKSGLIAWVEFVGDEWVVFMCPRK